MPKQRLPAPVELPNLTQSLLLFSVDDLKWYAKVLTDKPPARRGELVVLLTDRLTDDVEVRRLWERLTPVQQQVVSEVVHQLGGRYNGEVIGAKYPQSDSTR